MSGITEVFGAALVTADGPFSSVESVKELMDVLHSYKIKNIDTAQIYGNGTSESLLGDAGASQSFTIDTKAAGGVKPGSGTHHGIVEDATESLNKLKVKKVDIFYLHTPDSTVPISDTLAGINELHKSGGFERFGLSNFKAEGVQKVYDHCEENNYVLPTVFQGNYSAVARKTEQLLFPTLRKLGMSFYAYSPIAGGFLAKTKQQALDGAGRMAAGGMYSGLYGSMVEVLDKWGAIAEEAECSRADLAYRWIKFSSTLNAKHGDAVIIGASSIAQLKQTLNGIRAGPLPDSIVKKVEDVWQIVEKDAPVDNYHDYIIKQ